MWNLFPKEILLRILEIHNKKVAAPGYHPRDGRAKPVTH